MLRHLRTRTPLIAGIILLFIGIFASEYWHIYTRVAHFDKILHILGGVTVGWMAFALLQKEIQHLSGMKQLLIITALTCLVGVLWEFAEYLSNFTRHAYPVWYHYFHGGDLADTLGDIAADLIGGTTFALWALYKERS